MRPGDLSNSEGKETWWRISRGHEGKYALKNMFTSDETPTHKSLSPFLFLSIFTFRPTSPFYFQRRTKGCVSFTAFSSSN